jgi:hypothetical protein
MRRFLNVAMEEFKGEPLGDENLSMEEEAIMLDESSQCAAEADQDLKEAERIVEVANALEDLAVKAGSTEELSDNEAAILESAGDMAVAGTDIAPEEIVPAMESFRDAESGKISGKLAMENFREKAERLWQNIKKVLKEIWEKIQAFFYKIFGTIPRRRRALKALSEKVESTHSMTRENAKFTVGGSRFMFVGANAVKTAGAYESALKEFTASAKWVYDDYVSHLKSTTDIIAKALEGFDVEKPAEATKAVAQAVQGRVAKIPGAQTVSGGTRWSNFEVGRGHELLGGQSLFALAPKKSEGSGDLAILDHARQAMVQLEKSSEKAAAGNQSIEFTTMTQAEMIAAIKECEKLLDLMEGYQRGKAKGEIESAKKKISAASDKAEKAGESKRNGGEEERAAVPHFRALVNFNVALARWVESPTIQFTKLAFGVINQTEVLVSRSCAQYK